MFSDALRAELSDFAQADGQLTILTGAGISAESGIPTFRGKEGYWTVGSKEYHPENLATYAAFRHMPDDIWAWYLYRRSVCRQAEPNSGHMALVELEAYFGDRFTLITQNVDGLHLRAGNSLERTFQIHGNVDYMRCANACSRDIYPIPDGILPKTKDASLTDTDRELLICPRCDGLTRPHVLWFDEFYDEAFYRFNSSLAVAEETDLLIIIGTSGATNLPVQVALQVYHSGGTIINIDPNENLFGEFASEGDGYFLQGASGEVLPRLAKILQGVD